RRTGRLGRRRASRHRPPDVLAPQRTAARHPTRLEPVRPLRRARRREPLHRPRHVREPGKRARSHLAPAQGGFASSAGRPHGSFHPRRGKGPDRPRRVLHLLPKRRRDLCRNSQRGAVRFMKRLRTRVTGAALFLAARAAEASPLVEHTGALIGGGGFNARFTESGPAAAYFKPAFLTRSKTGISVGAFVLADRIRLTLGSREGLGVDVPSYPDSLQYEYDGQTAPFDNLTMPTRDLYMGCAIERNPCAPRPRQSAGSSNETRTYALIGLVNQIMGPKLV